MDILVHILRGKGNEFPYVREKMLKEKFQRTKKGRKEEEEEESEKFIVRHQITKRVFFFFYSLVVA